MLVKWILEQHAILQWKNKIMYALCCNFSQAIPMFLQFYRYSLYVTTKPSYTTTKEQNHISHMGIRTPCYTTIKEQNHISHMGIRTPCYTTTKEQNHINHMGIRTPWYTTTKEKKSY